MQRLKDRWQIAGVEPLVKALEKFYVTVWHRRRPKKDAGTTSEKTCFALIAPASCDAGDPIGSGPDIA